MMFTSLLAVSALASQAAAFLVPLEVSKAVQTAEDDYHLSLLNTKSQEVSLECPGCQFDTPNDRQVDYIEMRENTLVRDSLEHLQRMRRRAGANRFAGFEFYHQRFRQHPRIERTDSLPSRITFYT